MNGINNCLSINDLAENDVLTIEPGAWHKGQEELGAVGVWSSVSHRQHVGLSVFKGETLISELGAVDGLAAGTVASGEVAALGHEV